MTIQLLASQGAGGTAVPFVRYQAPYRLVPSEAVNSQDSLRLKRYEEHWRFFQGVQWGFNREDGEPLVTVNYCRPIVNKKASWLVGKGMTLTVPKALEYKTKPILDEVWEYNNVDSLLHTIATTGGVTGDVFLLPTIQNPTSQQLKINPYTEGKVRIRVLGSHQVFPHWNPLNIEELQYVRIVTEAAEDITGRDQIAQKILGGLKKRRYVEDIYPDRIVEGWDDGPQTVRENELGEIPLIHICNETFPGEFYGISDLDGIIDLQREFNEKATDISDIVHYHASPITIITGAKARNLDRGPKNVWSGLPTDAKVFNLKLEGDLSISHKYLDFLREAMFDLSGIPEGSLGKIQAISNTSAAALQIQFQPLIEATDRKRPNYEAGLKKVNYYILRLHQLITKEAYPIDLCKNCGGRILEFKESGDEGTEKVRRKCYMINHQTLDFLTPDEVKINIKRKFSYGVETRMLPYSQVKKEYLKEGSSYWDPGEEKDLQEEAERKQEEQRKLQEHQHSEMTRVSDEHAANNPTVTKDPKTGADKLQQAPVPPAPPGPPPKELQPEPEVKPEQLEGHDMDIPEEPETVNVTVRTWDHTQGVFITKNLGQKQIVPTGCDCPRFLSPYENTVKLRSTLPRDKQMDANLYAVYQDNGWASRHWIMEQLEEDMNRTEIDKQIADDIPLLLAKEGMPQPGQVAQTAGANPQGSNNGAPNPPVPGPGRGNKFGPGDNLANAGPVAPTIR